MPSFDLTSNTALYYFVLVVFMAAVVGLWRLTHSPFGRVLSAIRQSETRAAHLGYRVRLYKMAVFTISAALSGLAGGLFAMAQNSAFPDVMSLHYSGIIVMMVLIGGGMVSFWGPVIGVVVYLIARDVIGARDELLDAVVRAPLHRGRAVQAGGHRRRGAELVETPRPEARARLVPPRAGAEGLGAMAMLDARDIHVRFGDRVVLEDISFAVEPGELHGIMGPNGAGKTTFFNVLTGRVKPARGSVRIAGEDVTGLPPHAIAARGLARSFQIMTLFDEFTALENVEVALPEFRARGFDGYRSAVGDKGFEGAARAVLAEVGLAEKAEAVAKDLPYGDRRALEIAVALAAAPARAVPRRADLRPRLGRRHPSRGPDPAPEGAAVDRRDRARHGVPVRARRPHLGGALGPGHRQRPARGAEAKSLGAGLEPRAAAMTVAAALPRSEPATAGGAEALLACEGIHTFYGETQVLFDVSFAVAPGAVFALLGPNGAGKTTTLRSILGLTRPKRGRIRFGGADVTHWPTHRIARAGIAWVPDDRRLCPTLTVAKNLSIAQKRTRFRPWSLKETCEIFSALDHLMHREAENLSGGEMQMVAISRALLGSPGLVLLDEPSQGLAPKIVADVLATIRRLKDEGIAAIVVEQNAEVALSVADHAAVLDRGRIAWSGPAAELRDDRALRRKLLGA